MIDLFVWRRRNEAGVAWYFHSIIDQGGGTAVGVLMYFGRIRKEIISSKLLQGRKLHFSLLKMRHKIVNIYILQKFLHWIWISIFWRGIHSVSVCEENKCETSKPPWHKTNIIDQPWNSDQYLRYLIFAFASDIFH